MAEDNELDVEIEALLREVEAGDLELSAPPADTWDAIVAGVADEHSETSPLTPPPAPMAARRGRSPRTWVLGAAAAVLAAVLVAGVAIVVLGRSDGAEVIAQAELAYDPAAFDPLGAGAGAKVKLIDDDGRFRVEFDDADLPEGFDEAADLELWLIEPDADGNVADLVSLGTVAADELGSFDVPATHDPDEFFVVDISVEPRDGDAAHSGRSILRGPLVET